MTDISARARVLASSKHLLKAGTAIAAVALAVPAFAQDTTAAPATQETGSSDPSAQSTAPDIVVTGYARSIANAIAAKKNAVNIIEAVSAEDIGKLPDVSITDSLARLPGVAVQQASGRAKYISIRGFGPDYTTATLNGRMIATVDDNRRFDYGQYPGDLFQQIAVIKTPSADLINFGLAGAVNLQTYDPLTQKNTAAINLQGQVGQYASLNPEGSNKGYKASLLVMHKFADDTLGVSLGFSAIKDPTQNYHWATGGGNGNYYGPGNTDPITGGLIAPDDIQNYANTNTLYRQSGFGHVVYRPNDRFEMSVDALYTQSKIREYSRGWEMPLASWSKDTLVPGSLKASNGYVDSWQWNVYPVLRNDFNTSNAETFAVGGNVKYKLTDNVKFVLDGNYSRARRHDNTYEIYGGSANAGNGQGGLATITRQSNGTYAVDIAGINYADPADVSLTDPQGWNQVGFNNVPDLTDTVKGLRAELDGEIHGGFFSGWEVGVNYTDEKKVSNYSGYYICLPGPSSTAGCGNDNAQVTSVAIPSSIITGAVEPYAVTGTQLIALDAIAAQNLLRTAEQGAGSNAPRDWTVDEKITTGYVQANIDTVAGDVPVTGNIGAQFVHTDQSSLGAAPLPSVGPTAATSTYGKTSYNYLLPSANLNVELMPNFLVRFALSRTLSRSKMDNENASYGVGVCQGVAAGQPAISCQGVPAINGKQPVLGATGGNPYIRPYLSTNVDISLEKYFAHNQGKLALAGYYKAITNFTTQNQNLNNGNINSNGPTSQTTYAADCTAFANLPNLGVLQSNQTLECWTSAPINDGRGYVIGFEASATVPLSAITSALDGFSVIGQWAHTDSEIKFSNGNKITLPGLSKNIYQAQVFFEKWGFNARASLTRRSPYLGDYQLFNAQVTANLTKAQTTLDAQIGYDFHSGPLDGLSVYLQGHNLTNSESISYVNNDPNEVNIRDQYGATYLAGVTMHF
jgi:iron complex outermembrane receptor protein